MISLCAVLVSTPQARSLIIASSSFQESLSRSASRPSSTAANATCAPGTGLPPCITLIFAIAVWRTAYCGLSAVTLTCSSCAARPTCSLATPSLNAGLARSTIAVGATQSLPSPRKLRHHSSGARQPQVKNEYQGVSRIRPRRARTLT